MVWLIKPINIYVEDLDCTLLLSYRTNCVIGAGKRVGHRNVGGSVNYLLDNDYGFNTTSVNAILSQPCLPRASLRNFNKFFAPQELLKWGIAFRKQEGWAIMLQMIFRKFMNKLNLKR